MLIDSRSSSLKLVDTLKRCFKYQSSILTLEEKKCVLDFCIKKFKRMPFEYNHLDGVISGYREMLKSNCTGDLLGILRKVERLTGPLNNMIHFIEIEKDGHIDPHIDNIDSCGSVVAAINLCTDAILKFEDPSNPFDYALVKLEDNSLYITCDDLRYQYKHSIPLKANFNNEEFIKSNRLSLVFRNKLYP